MSDFEFDTHSNRFDKQMRGSFIGFILGVVFMLGMIKLVQPDTPAYFLYRYNRAVVEEQKRHNTEQLRHNIALYGEQK